MKIETMAVMIFGLLGMGVAAPGGLAQATNLSSVTAARPQGVVVVPERPTAPDVTSVAGVRPDRVERPAMSPEILTRIERFKRDARAYLDRQEALKKKLLGANDTDRARIRAEIEDLRRKWLDESKRFRIDTKARAPELMRKLPGHREVIGSQGDNSGGRDR